MYRTVVETNYGNYMTRKALNLETIIAIIGFIFIIWASYRRLRHDIFIDVFKNSILLSLPLIALYGFFKKKSDKVPQYIARSIGMIMVPIGLIFWNWIHHKSVFYEQVLAMLVACLLIGFATIDRIYNKSEA